jgi:hypothetical protein
MVEARCCYFGEVSLHVELCIQVDTQITHDSRRLDEFLADQNRAINNVNIGKINARTEPDHFCFVGIQLQTTRCTPACHVCYTIRQTCPYNIDVFRTAAGTELSVVSVEVSAHSVSGQLASNNLGVGNEFLGSLDGSLGNAAVNWKTRCLLTSVDERLCATTQVRLKRVKCCVNH